MPESCYARHFLSVKKPAGRHERLAPRGVMAILHLRGGGPFSIMGRLFSPHRSRSTMTVQEKVENLLHVSRVVQPDPARKAALHIPDYDAEYRKSIENP